MVCKDYTVSQESFTLVKCVDCSFVYTNPRPKEEYLGKYYESENYISHSNTGKGLVNKLYKLVRTFTLRKKWRLVEAYINSGTLLDYGSGTGMFLSKANCSTWNVYGIEPDLYAREFSIKQNKQNVFSDIDDLEKQNPGCYFECITLWHVLEHVPDLRETTERLISKIKKGGALIIAVPNHDSWDANFYKEHWAAYDVPRHLYHFTEKNILELITPLGLVHQASLPMKYDSFYVSLLSEKYKYGTTNYIRAFINGLKSNMSARKASNYSSVIYVFKKP